MSELTITIHIPEGLVKRAERVGIQLDDPSSKFLNLVQGFIEEEIRKREALQAFNQIAAELASLPAEMKPTPEEIEAEIKAYRKEQELHDGDRS